MALRLAGAARYHYRVQRGRRRLLIVGTVSVLVLVGVVVYRHLMPKAAVQHQATAAAPLSFGAKQAADVSLVGGAIGQYASANNALPTSFSVAAGGELVLCGTVCDPVTYEVGGLSVYKAASIKLMSYTPGLAAPDQSTMYVVPGAKCGSDGRMGNPNPAPNSAVILYSAQTSGDTQPRCIVL